MGTLDHNANLGWKWFFWMPIRNKYLDTCIKACVIFQSDSCIWMWFKQLPIWIRSDASELIQLSDGLCDMHTYSYQIKSLIWFDSLDKLFTLNCKFKLNVFMKSKIQIRTWFIYIPSQYLYLVNWFSSFI